jgi:hypothetical protein
MGAADGYGEHGAGYADHGQRGDLYGDPYGDRGGHDLTIDPGYPEPDRYLAEPAPLYRPSLFEAALNLLQPSGTKLLVSATAMIFLAATGHALGVFSLPFFGDDGSQEVQGVETSSTTILASPTTHGGNTDVTRFGAAVGQSTTTAPSSTTTVQEAPAPAPTTTEEAPAPTEPETTPAPETTATTESTVPSTTTTTPTTTTTTTSSTTSAPEPGEVVLPPGEDQSVPEDAPAGSYRSRAEGACEVVITGEDGEESTARVDWGRLIEFDLVEGDTVTVGDGCPDTYQVS